jgi:outer membrane protein OmpA-like peptidoglycan-associated protein
MVVAQIRLDVGTALGFTTANASFRQLPGFPSCCPSFDGGSGTGGQFSLGVDVPLWSSLFASMRLAVSDRSHTLTTTEYQDIILGNAVVQGAITHTIDAPLTEVGIESSFGYRWSNLVLRLGGGYAARTFGRLRAREEITAPSGALFGDTRSNVRNVRTGDLAESITSTLYGVGSVGFDIPLNRVRSWRLTPEVAMAFGFSSMTSVTSWSVIVPSIGVRLSYELGVAPAQPPAKTTVPSTKSGQPIAKQIETPKPQTPRAQPEVHDVELSADVREAIRIEEIEEERYQPILPYVFFERGSDVVPERYESKESLVALSARLTPVQFHHRVLSVIAERMRQFPSAEITLVGTSANDDPDTTIALRRARAIATVFTQGYGIAAKRLKVRARRLPANTSIASGAEASLADEENRRVEILASNADVLAPYRTADTVGSMTPPSVTVRVRTSDGAPINRWVLRANDNRVDSSARPATDAIVFTPDGAAAQELIQGGKLRLSLSGDHKGAPVSDTLDLPIKTVRLIDKRRERRNDSIIERFELVVFPFRSAELTDEHRRVLDFVRGRVGKGARIQVEGCTDIIGSKEDNDRISLERARAVAAQLSGRVTAVGRGEPDASQSQRLPEERMLQRVVRITAVVPTK